MTKKPIELLAEAIELIDSLPSDPAEYTAIPARKRNAMRTELTTAINHLQTVALSLDQVRLPKNVFDPTSPKVIAELVAKTLLLEDKQSMGESVKHKFYGAGVYAIYLSWFL